jgi:hypothetical protein
MDLLDAVLGVNRRLGERVDGELEALASSGGQVVDLREPDAGELRPVRPTRNRARTGQPADAFAFDRSGDVVVERGLR